MENIPVFEDVSIVVIGDVMLDSYWYGSTDRLSPEAPVPVVNIGSFDKRPGGAANVALNIKSLGAQVKLVGLCGNDVDGTDLLKCLAERGINSSIIKQDNVKTINKLKIFGYLGYFLKPEGFGLESININDLFLLIK